GWGGRYASYFFFQAEDGIRDRNVTGVQTCALPICNLLQHFGIADVFALFEVGAEKLVDHRLAGALALSELDQAVRSEGVGRAQRSEERRVGKEGRCGGWPTQCKGRIDRRHRGERGL